MARARKSEQLKLFDIVPRFTIESNAQARNYYGALAQELVCLALNLKPIPINGNYEVCFDAERDGEFFEIKSVKANGKIPIYIWRMEKERRVAEQVKCSYAILTHKVRHARSSEELFEKFSSFPLQIYHVSVEGVHRHSEDLEIKKLKKENFNPRFGYNRKGYKDGYKNVSMRNIAASCVRVDQLTCNLYGKTFAFEVYNEVVPEH